MKNHLLSSQPWKRLLLPALAAGSLLLPASLQATLPITGSGNLTVIFGSATYPTTTTSAAGALNITATSTNTVLGWTAFGDLGAAGGGTLVAGDLINYILPTTSSAVLNLITGAASTTLQGATLASNGKILILNPNGVAINTGTTVNAAAFYASSVPETLAYFESNGALQVFSGTAPATATANGVTVQTGVQLSTIGGSGTIGLAGNSVSIAGGNNIVGNLYVETQGGAVTLASSAGGLSVGSASAGGALTVISNGGAINLAQASNTTIFGAATISSIGTTNGAVSDTTGFLFSATTAGTLSTINAGTGATAGTVTFNNDGVTGAIDVASIGVNGQTVALVDNVAGDALALGTSTIQGTLTASANGAINNTGAVAATGAISLTSGAKSINFSTTGNVSFTNVSAITGSQSITITGTGSLSFSGTLSSPTISVTTTGGTYTDLGLTAATKATISASGNVSLGTEGGTGTLAVTSGNTILQTGAITATKSTFTAPTITLLNAGNNISSIALVGGGGSTGVQVLDAAAGGLTVATGTNVTGATTISNTTGNITLGAVAADTLSFGSTLGLTVAGASTINTLNTLNVSVAGAVSLTTGGGAATLGVNSASNLSSFGQVSATTGGGALTINEGATTNLGTITTGAGSLTVNALGAIVNTGGLVVNVGGGATFSAGTATGPLTIQIGAVASAANAIIPGTITLANGSAVSIWDKPGAAVTVSTSAVTNPVIASEALWITDGNALTVNNAGSGSFGAISLNISGAGAGAIAVNDAGAATATNLTVTNVVDTATSTNTIGISTPGTLTLGSGISVLGSGVVTLASTAGTVTDTASSPIYIVPAVSITGNKGIAVNNNTANSLGAVSLTATTGSIAYTEGGTVNLAALTASGTSGTVSISSVTGSVTQFATGAAISIPAGFTASFSAPTGAVQLSGVANTINKADAISITAGGTATAGFASGGDVVGVSSLNNNGATGTLLGNVSIPLEAFTVASTGGSITQATGTSIFEFGAASFTTAGTGVITLANSGNNFGGLTLATANQAAKVTETGTSNYISVTLGTGALTAVSNANIIEGTGSTGIFTGAGTSFTTSTGSITVTNALNNFGNVGVQLVASGNAALTDANPTGTILADQTNVAGNLTVTNNQVGGYIKDAGSSSTITVGGTFAALGKTTGAGFVQFVGAASTFGAVEVQAGTSASSLLDNGPLAMAPGSAIGAGGSLTLTSAGNITTIGTGGSTFGGNLELVASGSIVVSNPLFVTGVLTVDAISGPTNLSFLSLVANLNSHAPVNLGNASNYTGPSP